MRHFNGSLRLKKWEKKRMDAKRGRGVRPGRIRFLGDSNVGSTDRRVDG